MADNSWIKFGKENPYFAVITHDEFKKENLTEEALKNFFATGERDVNHVIQTLKSKFSFDESTVERVLDFGCGTGRLVIPFAAKFKKVVGIDISRPMLDEAEKNVKARALSNVELIESSDISTLDLGEPFDLVHTFIVLQHMPTDAGYKTIEKLVSILKPGGYGMIHFTFSNGKSSFRNNLAEFKNRYNVTRGAWNIVQGKPFGEAVMQMNNYSLEQVFSMLISQNVQQTFMEFTNHDHLGVRMYFKK